MTSLPSSEKKPLRPPRGHWSVGSARTRRCPPNPVDSAFHGNQPAHRGSCRVAVAHAGIRSSRTEGPGTGGRSRFPSAGGAGQPRCATHFGRAGWVRGPLAHFSGPRVPHCA